MVTNFGTGGTAAPAIPVTGDVVSHRSIDCGVGW